MSIGSIGSLLALYWLSVDSLLALYWLSIGSLLALYWISLDSLLALYYWLSVVSLLTLYWLSIDSLLALYWLSIGFLLALYWMSSSLLTLYCTHPRTHHCFDVSMSQYEHHQSTIMTVQPSQYDQHSTIITVRSSQYDQHTDQHTDQHVCVNSWFVLCTSYVGVRTSYSLNAPTQRPTHRHTQTNTIVSFRESH
jgi:hypothetical protein